MLLVFLKTDLYSLIRKPQIPPWLALQCGPSIFGVFYAFADEEGRNAHLTGPITIALMTNVDELLS